MIIPVIPDLDTGEQNALSECVDVWCKRLARNATRTLYYEAENRIKDLRISLPPQLAAAEAMVGWPAKAVNSLADRCSLDGFVSPGGDQDPFELSALLAHNEFDIEYHQAVRSSMVHGVSFVTVTRGDVQSGEPAVQLLPRSAQFSAATWDRRRRTLKAAMAVTDCDEQGQPTQVVLYLPNVVVECNKAGNRWSIDRKPNPLGYVPVFRLPYAPGIDKPFGQSRISRVVMQLTDMAIRTFVRAEVGAEFYASPQRYVLGAEEDQFSDDGDRWRALVSKWFAVGRDEDGNVPTVGQFQQLTMQPHLDQLRTVAAAFAGETSIPLDELGVVHDNPSSAEAIYAAKEPLIIAANNANRVYGGTLKRMAIAAVQIRDGLSAPTDELYGLTAKFNDPFTPSQVSAADAVVKQVSAVPWLADTELVLERLGYDQPSITRLMADKKRAQAQQNIQSLAASSIMQATQNVPQNGAQAHKAGGKPATVADQGSNASIRQ